MTRERFGQLFDLVDEVNRKVNANVSIEHGKRQDSVHIMMFYVDEGRTFFTEYGFEDYDVTNNDDDLVKAECFLRLLLASAEHCEVMRR